MQSVLRLHGSSIHLRSMTMLLHYCAYTLAESSMADRLYKLAVLLVFIRLHGLAPSYLADELHHPAESRVSKVSAVCVVTLTVCSSHSTINLRRLSFTSLRSSHLQQSVTSCRHCTVSSCLLLSFEDTF